MAWVPSPDSDDVERDMTDEELCTDMKRERKRCVKEVPVSFGESGTI
jgi:hypothetical protein